MKTSGIRCAFRVWCLKLRNSKHETRNPKRDVFFLSRFPPFAFRLLPPASCLFIACCLFLSGCGGGGGSDAAAGGGSGNPVTSTSCPSSSNTGSISVSSKPAGASIIVDGADTGQTTPKPSGSVTIGNITEGTHTVKLSASGWSDYETTVCVSASGVQTISAQLTLSTDIAGNSI